MTETKRPTNQEAEKLLDLYFPVLDGFISLVDYSGTDQCIERAARVSYGAGTRKVSKTRNLIRHLRRLHHTSPSEMVELKFHVCCPIFVMRQWCRHRASSFSEYSGRYSLMPMLFYTPPEEQFKAQSKDNNQGRDVLFDKDEYNVAISCWNGLRKQSSKLYEDLAGADVARELARIDLPLSTYTQFFWKIDLHNLLHFLTLRTDSYAQYEIRVYANVIAGMLKSVAPLSFEAWIDYNLCSANFSRMELDVLKEILHCYKRSVDGVVDIDLKTGNGLSLSADNKFGLSKREIDELCVKLNKPAPPSFDLDLTQTKSSEYFQEKMLAAVPKVDKDAHY